MGIQWRYVACDLRSGAELCDVPLSDVRVVDEVNAPGSLDATVRMSALGEVRRRSVRASVLEGRTALYVLGDGHPLWGGIVWDLVPLSDGNLSVRAAGFLSYFARRVIATSATFTSVDQFTIAAAMVNTAQAAAGGNIRVDVPSVTCGVPRDMTYAGHQLKPVLEALQQLAALDNGFDLSIDPYRDPDTGVLSQRLSLWYPHKGRSVAATGVLLSYPGNVRDYSWPRTASEMATTVYAVGQGDGDAIPVGTATNPGLIDAGWPVLDEVTSYSDQDSVTALTAHARADADLRNGPRVTPTLTVGALDPPVTEYAAGDHVRVRITDPCNPAAESGGPGLDTSGRIVRREITIPDDGEVTVDLTLNPGLVGPGALALAGLV